MAQEIKTTPRGLPRRQLIRIALIRVALALLALGAMLFIPAGTLRYWEAWVWLAVLFIPMLALGAYLIWRDPSLLERRLRTREREQSQSLMVRLSLVWFLVAFIIPGLDRRFHWSDVPTELVVASDLLVLIGYIMIAMVLRENTYASRVVEVVQGQQVIDTGPYAVVRHPMYLGAIVLFAFTPLALGSYWAVLPIWLFIPIITMLRIPAEEEVLRRELPGYEEYMQRVKHRLVPGIW